ncbi:MAG: hypothetical protein ACFFDY_11420 [Candidatus Thorarchaeota archaeon]
MKSNYEICTWKNSEVCDVCSIKGKLICHFRTKFLLSFLSYFLVYVITTFIGIILGGFGWYLLGWIGFWLFFFEVWEIRILCSHCPYYAEEGNTLHCIANYSSLKLWKYHPEPMNLSEKIQLIVGFIILMGYPLIFLILGRQFIFLIISIVEILVFFSFLSIKRCGACPNFSCPFNRVEKEIVDSFLENNPIMKKAWKDSGYKI